ncbi:MAG: hypothetical protein EA415_12190 [Sphaerobacteraceae bacterium]|nr:MAG: hypothetical protein EA415_12190 [Sphaerobacteraceae bacterium]
MIHRPDESKHLEDALREIQDDVFIPDTPDVRKTVAKRLQRIQSIDGSATGDRTPPGHDELTGSGNQVVTEPVPLQKGKSMVRQFVEMAAAVVVLVVFTGLLVLLFREQAADGDLVPGIGEATPTATADASESMPVALEEATPIDDYQTPDAPYRVPESCDVTEPVGPHELGDLQGFWYTGDNLSAVSRDRVLYEGGNLFNWESSGESSDPPTVTTTGERLDEPSDSVPYIWMNPSGDQNIARGYLGFPEAGCWEVQLESDDGGGLNFTAYIYPRYEREIVAERNLGVTIESASSEVVDDEYHHRVDFSLRHPDLPEIDQLQVEDVFEVVWVEDEDGSRPAPVGIDFLDPGVPDGTPVGSPLDVHVPTVPDGPLQVAFIYETVSTADDLELVIDLPEDHPDPGMPDTYRVNFAELMDSVDQVVEPTPTVVPSGPPSDSSFAISYSRMLGDEPVLSFVDPEGNELHDVKGLPGHPWGPELFSIAGVTSPDGQYVVHPGDALLSGNLFVRDVLSGDETELLVDTDYQDANPVWSSHGEWIAFERVSNGHIEIFKIRADGSDLQQLTETDDGAGRAVWSPDGERIAFLSPPSWEEYGAIEDPAPGHTPFQIYVVNADGSDQLVVEDAAVSTPEQFASEVIQQSGQIWSPDSQRIAYVEYEVDDSSDGALPRLAIADVERGLDHINPDEVVNMPAWSPDGQRIAYLSEGTDGQNLVEIVDPQSGEASTIYQGSEQLSHPMWSPDGRELLLQGRQNDPAGTTLLLVEVETGDLRIVADQVVPMFTPQWIEDHRFGDD